MPVGGFDTLRTGLLADIRLQCAVAVQAARGLTTRHSHRTSREVSPMPLKIIFENTTIYYCHFIAKPFVSKGAYRYGRFFWKPVSFVGNKYLIVSPPPSPGCKEGPKKCWLYVVKDDMRANALHGMPKIVRSDLTMG